MVGFTVFKKTHYSKAKGQDSMKISKNAKIISILAAILLAAFFTTACQQIAGDPMASQSMESAVKISESTVQTDDSIKYNAPPNYQGYFTAYDSKLKVTINADIDFPDAEIFPVYEFAYKQFSREQLDAAINELIGSAELYFSENVPTKGELQDYINELKKTQNDKKNETSAPARDEYTSAEDLEASINNLEEQIIYAPETHEKTKISSQYFSSMNSIDAVSHVEGKGDVRFYFFKGLKGANQLIFDVMPFCEQNKSYEVGDLGISVSKQEAVEIARQTAFALGAAHMEPVAVLSAERAENWDFSIEENIEKAYAVIFTRKQDGLQTLYTGLDLSFGYDIFNDQTEDRTSYEVLKIFVSDAGVVGVRWFANGEIGEKISDNAKMMPFDQIMQRFEDQMVYNNSRVEFETEFLLNIDHIKLGYLPVPEKDTGKLLWTPVWSFYGSADNNGGSTKQDEYTVNYRPQIILNAVDGSNIVC